MLKKKKYAKEQGRVKYKSDSRWIKIRKIAEAVVNNIKVHRIDLLFSRYALWLAKHYLEEMKKDAANGKRRTSGTLLWPL